MKLPHTGQNLLGLYDAPSRGHDLKPGFDYRIRQAVRRCPLTGA